MSSSIISLVYPDKAILILLILDLLLQYNIQLRYCDCNNLGDLLPPYKNVQTFLPLLLSYHRRQIEPLLLFLMLVFFSSSVL